MALSKNPIFTLLLLYTSSPCPGLRGLVAQAYARELRRRIAIPERVPGMRWRGWPSGGTSRAGLALIVGLVLASSTCASAAASSGRAAAAFSAHGSAEQVYVTGLGAG